MFVWFLSLGFFYYEVLFFFVLKFFIDNIFGFLSVFQGQVLVNFEFQNCFQSQNFGLYIEIVVNFIDLYVLGYCFIEVREVQFLVKFFSGVVLVRIF